MPISATKYDLEDRCLKFAQSIIEFTRLLPPTTANIEYSKQIIRSAGSVGANYIESNDALGRKDFVHRIKIARKEARETRYWLHLLAPNSIDSAMKESLISECTEIIKILSAIANKFEA